jgi:hypothetical protein
MTERAAAAKEAAAGDDWEGKGGGSVFGEYHVSHVAQIPPGQGRQLD